MKTILAPVDFSPVTTVVLDQAAALAAALPARVILVHVTRPQVLTSEHGLVLDTIIEVTGAADKAALRRLERLRTSLAARCLNVELEHLHGTPEREILKLAKASAADYIVIGSHGHTALFDLVMGSTAHGVIRRAECPVVLVPSRPVPSTRRLPRRRR